MSFIGVVIMAGAIAAFFVIGIVGGVLLVVAMPALRRVAALAPSAGRTTTATHTACHRATAMSDGSRLARTARLPPRRRPAALARASRLNRPRRPNG